MAVIGGPLDRQPLIDRLPSPEDYINSVDTFYEMHRASYDSNDFALPFLELVIASQNENRVKHRDKNWALAMHQALIERAYDTGTPFAKIAISSASSLYDSLLKNYTGEYFHYYFTLNYDSSVPSHPKITTQNKEWVNRGLRGHFSEKLRVHYDAGDYLYHVYSIPDPILFNEHLYQLRDELLHSSLDQIFFDEGANMELQQQYMQIAPHFFSAFQEAFRRGFVIQGGNQGAGQCCGCPIL